MDLKDMDPERLKGLLRQAQGKDVLQNYVTVDLRERHKAFRTALVHYRDKQIQYLNDDVRTRQMRKYVERTRNTLNELIQCFWDEEKPKMNKFNIGKIMQNMEIYKPLILKAFPIYIESLEKDIQEHKKNIGEVPELEKRLGATKEVFEDFKVLTQLKSTSSTPYLRQLTKVF